VDITETQKTWTTVIVLDRITFVTAIQYFSTLYFTILPDAQLKSRLKELIQCCFWKENWGKCIRFLFLLPGSHAYFLLDMPFVVMIPAETTKIDIQRIKNKSQYNMYDAIF
jgi:hypothetical protein